MGIPTILPEKILKVSEEYVSFRVKKYIGIQIFRKLKFTILFRNLSLHSLKITKLKANMLVLNKGKGAIIYGRTQQHTKLL